jgi:hypothetical protein
MNTRILLFAGTFLAAYLPAYTQPTDSLSPAQAEAAFQAEQQLVEQARAAVARGDLMAVDRALFSEDGQTDQIAASVALARRAVGVCAWSRNNGDDGSAMRIAERAVTHLAAMQEERDSDRVERLYWEAVLRGDFLDQKAVALSLLQASELLAPNDDRIVENQLQLADALAAFGR